MDPAAREVVRHLVATLAYRAAKVLRDVPPDFATRPFGDSTRVPVSIVAHLGDLMAWGVSIAHGGYDWRPDGGRDWHREVDRFFEHLSTIDRELASETFAGSIEHLIQGPLTDALWHVGQLAMLRGMAGAPVRPESYARADIVAGRIGLDQAAPRAEFDGDASTRK
jgi:hypothetical protein